MKKFLFLPFLLLAALTCGAQNVAEKKVASEIKSVTVFLNGAQINREAASSISAGTSVVSFDKLSPFIDEKSIQVQAEGDFTVLSVMHSLDYLNKEKRNDSLQNALETVNTEVASKNARLEVLNEKESLLDKNKDLSGDNNAASLTQLKQAIDFYDRELTAIKEDFQQTQKEIEMLLKQKALLEKELANVSAIQDLPSGKISVKIESDRSTSANFKVSYVVKNAGWYPNYDLRAKNTSDPVQLKYKANVYQNTGNDWNNVKLKLSSGNPNQNGTAPEMETWYLNYPRNTIYAAQSRFIPGRNISSVSGTVIDEYGDPVPGVNVMVKGTTIGAYTDFDGKYEISVPSRSQFLVFSFVGFKTEERPIINEHINVVMTEDANSLDEVLIGYGVKGARVEKSPAREIKTTAVETNTTVEFEVEKPYSIPSNGEKFTVNLADYEIDASYEYYTVPKLEEKAYLIAKITNWQDYNLLEGETSLFYENTYVGKTVLDAGMLSDTLSVSLGQDSNISIDREKIDQFSSKKFIGSNKVDSREFSINIRNRKSEAVTIHVSDQVPVAAISAIEVKALELSGGNLNEKTGEVNWEIRLDPGTQKELKLQYEVKYPKSERVQLE
ncbi:MAG: mucoidy inhibitor MuiA family protein [Christiangramia sp.]|uniref:mucoidy inhibitor MuiA family protein n=1 Tax=Christiangramia sp. TaxID=1931228 RepID=UPI003241F712